MAERASLSRTQEQAFTNIAELLLRAACQRHSSGLQFAGEIARDPKFVSYPELLREAQQILGGLQSRSTAPGGKVALLLERPRDFIPAFWACILGGFIPCPMAPIRSDADRWAKHLGHVNTLLDGPLFVSTGHLLRELPWAVTSVAIDELRGNEPHEETWSAKPEDAAILMLTSGSTGNSMAVELTHANLLASMAGRAQRQQLSSADVTFNWIAFDHVAALLEQHMIALYVGATQLHTEPAAVLTDPLQFLRLIHRYRVTLAFAPNFLLGQINAALQAESLGATLALDLSCLRRIVTGGEANVVATGRRFLELLAPYGLARNVLWPAFGMTETCAASVYSHEFPECDVDREFAAVGTPIEGMELRIVDDAGRACAPSQAGELQVRGAVIFRRYYHNEEATHAAFTADGWFRTGDVGRIDDGRLYLVARNKDSIIVNGVNYYSHELETKLEQLAGIERSYVAAFPTRADGADTEQLVVTFATEISPEDEAGLYQLIVAVRNTTIMLWGFRPFLILPLPKDAFPKTSLGKIQRSLMRKRLEAGALGEFIDHAAQATARQGGPFTAPAGPLEIGISNVFAEVLRIDLSTMSSTASFFDLGGTSLDILKFTQKLERGFGLKGGLPIVLQNPSVRQLAQYISLGVRQPIRRYDPIVPLQTTGRRTPLFCVHPGNGEVFVLVNVAKYFLNDRPFYAIRPRGFNEGEERFGSVAEMIDTYVTAIMKRQSRGPYAIAGYSLGGEIAFEVAKEIERRGEKVGFLGCIDVPPRLKTSMLNFNMATALAMVTDLITKEKYLELNKILTPELPSDEVCEEVLKFASPERLLELDVDLPKFAAWARVAHSMEDMLFANPTSGRMDSMTIFCSEGISLRYANTEWSRQTWAKELRRWDQFVANTKYVDIPGHHHTLMGPQNVAVFQAALRAEVDEALERLVDGEILASE